MLSFQISALRWGRVSQGRLYENPAKTAIDKATSLADSCISERNGTGTRPVEWHKSDTARSGSVHANENPGELAGSTGAKTYQEAGSFNDEQYRLRVERARTLFLAIADCDPADAAIILSDALQDLRVGAPLPPLMSAMDEATTWARWATPFEHKAFCLASFNAMRPHDQAGFLAHVQGRAAA